MERWLSKSRVLLILCAVLLSASLNRKSPLVYGLFLFLVVLLVLAYLIPWLSLRGMSVRLDGLLDLEISEHQGAKVGIHLHRRYRWPAFMIKIETVWDWESFQVTHVQALPIVSKGSKTWMNDGFKFPCRGNYRLKTVALTSGFPLGFVHARLELKCPDVQVQVLPEPHPVNWPSPWDISEDPSGELTMPRLGNSLELSLLQPYIPGERVGRINWRATARTGELIIQHFHQTGSIRLHVVMLGSDLPERGNPNSAAEQVIRITAGVCQAALNSGAALRVYGHVQHESLQEWRDILQALAGFLPKNQPLHEALSRVELVCRPGEQLALIVPHHAAGTWLLGQLQPLVELSIQIVVWIGLPRFSSAKDLEQAQRLRSILQDQVMVTLVRPTDE